MDANGLPPPRSTTAAHTISPVSRIQHVTHRLKKFQLRMGRSRPKAAHRICARQVYLSPPCIVGSAGPNQVHAPSCLPPFLCPPYTGTNTVHGHCSLHCSLHAARPTVILIALSSRCSPRDISQSTTGFSPKSVPYQPSRHGTPRPSLVAKPIHCTR